MYLRAKGNLDSDFSQNFFIFRNFVHACCFITHMIPVPLAENRGGRIKGKCLATPKKVSGRLRTDQYGQAQKATRNRKA
nr:hypothetical protein [Pseudomonas syringae]